MPGFTHLKNAQAISFAHYLMAYVEMFNRDKKRFNNNLDNLDENPLVSLQLLLELLLILIEIIQQKNLGLKNLLIIQLIQFLIEILF